MCSYYLYKRQIVGGGSMPSLDFYLRGVVNSMTDETRNTDSEHIFQRHNSACQVGTYIKNATVTLCLTPTTYNVRLGIERLHVILRAVGKRKTIFNCHDMMYT